MPRAPPPAGCPMELGGGGGGVDGCLCIPSRGVSASRASWAFQRLSGLPKVSGQQRRVFFLQKLPLRASRLHSTSSVCAKEGEGRAGREGGPGRNISLSAARWRLLLASHQGEVQIFCNLIFITLVLSEYLLSFVLYSLCSSFYLFFFTIS